VARTGAERLRARLDAHLAAGGWLLGEGVGVHGLTHGLSGDGVQLTPLSEQATLGLATGVAMAGRAVVVSLVDPSGLARAAEVLADAAGLAARSDGGWTAPVAVLVPWDPALPELPGVPLHVASSAGELVPMLEAALAARGPVVVAMTHAALDSRDEVVPLAAGTARVVRAGASVTVLALGDGVAPAVSVASAYDAEVIDLRVRWPLDVDAVAASVRRTGRVVTVGAPHALVAAVHAAFWHLESPPVDVPADAEALARALDAALAP
jgi:pyruvate dehydrogenase E1 component beta subunit